MTFVSFVKFYFRVQTCKMGQMGLPTSGLICLWLLTSREVTVTGLAPLSRRHTHLPDAGVYPEDLRECQSKRLLNNCYPCLCWFKVTTSIYKVPSFAVAMETSTANIKLKTTEVHSFTYFKPNHESSSRRLYGNSVVKQRHQQVQI